MKMQNALAFRQIGGTVAVFRIILVFVMLGVLPPPAIASDRMDPDLLKPVLRIETAPDAAGNYGVGTGFLISTTDDNSGKLFLITNKHMIGDWNYADRDVQTFRPWINVFFHRTGDRSEENDSPTRIDLLNSDGLLDRSRIILHVNPAIDLAAIDVTEYVNKPDITYSAYKKSYLLPFDRIQEWQTDIGDEVIALGYPLGIRSLRNNFPIAKVGYLASSPGQEVSIPFPSENRNGITAITTVGGKFLVVDGLIVNGNSGGPLLLTGGLRIRRDPHSNALQFLDKPIKNLVIGVVSGGLGTSGLSVIVSSDYLIDLLKAADQTAQ